MKKLTLPFGGFASVVCALLALTSAPLHAASDTWNLDANGTWDTAVTSSWLGGTVPQAAGETANFTNVISASRTITMNSAITVGSIVFNSHNLFDGSYTIAAGTGTLTLDATSGNASILVGNSIGNAAQTISTGVALNDSLDVTVNALGTLGNGLNISGVISTGSGSTAILKNGNGSLNLSNVSNTFTGDLYVNAGFLQIGADGNLGNVNNDIYLNGGTLNVNNFAWAPASTRAIDFGTNGGSLNVTGNTMTLASAGQLTGSGRMVKAGVGNLTVGAANTGLTGPVYLYGGLVDASGSASASALGGGMITVGDNTHLTLANVDHSAKQLRAFQGSYLSANSTAQASMTRIGGNLTMTRGSMLIQREAGGNAGVNNMGTMADVIFGVEGTMASENVTVGGGSAWSGIGSGRNSGAIQSGTITVGGNFVLNAGYGSGSYGNLTFGNGATSAVSFNGTTPAIAYVEAGNGAAVGGLVQLSGWNPTNYSGISKFVVRSGGNLWATGNNSLGGKTVDLEIGANFGHTGNGQGSIGPLAGNASNTFGSSIINMADATTANLRANQGTTLLGGNFVIKSNVAAAQFNLNQAAQTGGAGVLQINELTIAANNAGVGITSGNSRTLNVTNTVAAGSNNFTLAIQGGTHTFAAAWTGNGVFTKSDAGVLVLTGNLASYTGNIVVKAGNLTMNPGTPADVFGGTSGTSLYKISDSNSAEGQLRGYGALLVNTDIDFNSRIDPTSTGMLGLVVNSANLTGVNGSSAFIAASGAGRTLSTSTLAAGAGSTYRLGGLGQTLSVTNGVLVGANNLVVGGYRNDLDGGAMWASGTGNVALTGSNSYTGTTRVNAGSVLILNGNNAIGGNATDSAGAINVFGTLSIGNNTAGGAGTIKSIFSGPINVNRGGLLLVDNRAANLDRIPDAVDVNLTGGSLTYQGGNFVGGQETIGDLTFANGSIVTVTRNTSGNFTTLNATSLVRSGQGTLTVNSTNNVLGVEESVANAAAGGASALAPVYIVGAAGAGNFLAYNASNTLVTATYTGAGINTTTATDIYRTGAAQTVTAANVATRALLMGHNVLRGAAAGAGHADDREHRGHRERYHQ
jgi:fibronectin-binding autotransporter adhesin